MKTDHQAGLLYALCGFAVLSCGDAIVKTIAGAWPAAGVASIRYGAAAVGLAVLLALREGAAGFRFGLLKWHLLRALGVSAATVGFFTALYALPIAEATSITFTSPIITAFLGAALLKEPVRRATWIASLVALAGVVIVLRPKFIAIGPAALLPLFSAFGMALLMVANRAVAGRGSALANQFIVAALATPMLVAALLAGHWSGLPALHIGTPPVSVVAKGLFIAVSASVAHWLIYLATTRAGAGTIAPMTYVQLLMALIWSVVLFHTFPDAVALGGAGLIIAAGIYLWMDGQRARNPAETEVAMTD